MSQRCDTQLSFTQHTPARQRYTGLASSGPVAVGSEQSHLGPHCAGHLPVDRVGAWSLLEHGEQRQAPQGTTHRVPLILEISVKEPLGWDLPWDP